MKLKIRHKLFLALLFTSVVVSLALHFFVKVSFERGFRDYVKGQEIEQIGDLREQLISRYQNEESWDFMTDNHRLWKRMYQETLVLSGKMVQVADVPEPPPGIGPPAGPERELRGLGPRISLYDADKKWIIGGDRKLDADFKMSPMIIQGKTIGYLGLAPEKKLMFVRDRHFLRQQTKVFALIPVIIVVMSLLISFPLTVHLLRPINAMTDGTRRLIAGRFKTRIPVSSGDELGVLSKDFNSLATTLEKNEQNRKQLVADISHELRTPLAILRGEIEALQDGVRQPSAHTFSGLHGEVMHLERMVSDLYELSMSDIGALNYKRVLVNPLEILQATVEMFEQRMQEKNLKISLHTGDVQECCVLADSARLQQLFSNILENSLRYTDGPGMVEVNLKTDKDLLRISFADSAPGVSGEQITMLFDRFYRVEGSRNRGTGGVGLGLAICKNIVDGHEGSIQATSSPLGGVLVQIELPLAS